MKNQQTVEVRSHANQRTFKNKISSCLFFSLILISNIAESNEFAEGAFSKNCFSYPAVAMTPYDESINQKKYRMTHERVYHADDKTGSVLLYGPVTPWNNIFGKGIIFSATYVDPDGKRKNSSVKAELRFVGGNGINIVSTLDSNNFANTTDAVQTMSTSLKFSQLSDKKGFYVVRMYLNRASNKFTPKAFGYSFCSAIS